jgi:hypothetical protein
MCKRCFVRCKECILISSHLRRGMGEMISANKTKAGRGKTKIGKVQVVNVNEGQSIGSTNLCRYW